MREMTFITRHVYISHMYLKLYRFTLVCRPPGPVLGVGPPPSLEARHQVRDSCLIASPTGTIRRAGANFGPPWLATITIAALAASSDALVSPSTQGRRSIASVDDGLHQHRAVVGGASFQPVRECDDLGIER